MTSNEYNEAEKLYRRQLNPFHIKQLENLPHFPDLWLSCFQNSNRKNQKVLRSIISFQTIKICRKLLISYKEYLFNAVQNTKFYPETNYSDPEHNHNTEINVVNSDTIDCALQLKEQGYNPVVLNMASEKVPGGGWRSGAGAQEENLFRRSTYHLSLENPSKIDWERNWSYPIPESGGIYSPNIIVFRNNEDSGYKIMKKSKALSFVAVPACRKPRLEDNRLANTFIDKTKDKIRTILRIGLLHHHDSIVLGAFGCGAFHNPPQHMAELFKEILTEKEFKFQYKTIYFAILDNAYSNNYQPFLEELAPE